MFTAEQKGEVLFLEMNSTRSNVNVLTREAAEELHRLLDRACSPEIKLIILYSKKPYSFLNGTELLLTNHINRQEDLDRLGETLLSVYERIAASSIPTVAAIEGNCFGCGMEFSFCCDYRVASDSYDTCFYMTELADYHFLPVYGGMSRLPRLVGLKPSVDLLLGGEKWRANQAKKFGLVDEVFRSENFFEDLKDYASQLLQQGPVKRPLPEVAYLESPDTDDEEIYCQQILAQISRLPPVRQPLYRQCFKILLSSLSNDCLQESSDGSQHWAAVGTANSRAAAGFFFVRNMAKVASLGSTSSIPKEPVTLSVDPREDFSFGKILSERKLPGLKIRHLLESRVQGSEENIYVYLEDLKYKKSHPVRVLWGQQEDLPRDEVVLLYFPLKEQSSLCEVFISKEQIPLFQSFLILLSHLGWEVIVVGNSESHRRVSPTNRMIELLFMYVKFYLSMGGNLSDLNYTLWLFGFEWSLNEIAERFEMPSFPSWPDQGRKSREDARFLEELFSNLYQESLNFLQQGILKHRSQVDLIMRLGLGYPLVREHFTEMMRKKAASTEQVDFKKESAFLWFEKVLQSSQGLRTG